MWGTCLNKNRGTKGRDYMDYKAQLETFARENGKENLYPAAVGIIASVNSSGLYTPYEKVHHTQQALTALTDVHSNEDIPWNVEEASAITEANEEFVQLDFTTELPMWTAEEIMRNDG